MKTARGWVSWHMSEGAPVGRTGKSWLHRLVHRWRCEAMMKLGRHHAKALRAVVLLFFPPGSWICQCYPFRSVCRPHEVRQGLLRNAAISLIQCCRNRTLLLEAIQGELLAGSGGIMLLRHLNVSLTARHMRDRAGGKPGTPLRLRQTWRRNQT